MSDFKQAIHLAKLEMKTAWGMFLALFLYYSFFTIVFTQGFDVLAGQFFGLDLFFLILFVFVPTWLRPKAFQYRRVSGDIWGTPGVFMFLQLPIKRNVIILKSLISYFVSSFPYQVYMLVALYLLSPSLQAAITPGSYASFTVIWLAFGIYIGFGATAMDVGSKLTTKKGTSILAILVLIAMVLLLFSFPFFFKHGIVEWTIIIATKWPLLSAILSILAAIIGVRYWQSKMMKTMNELDYL